MFLYTICFFAVEYDPNRYRLNFLRESKEELERRRYEAQTVAVKTIAKEEMEVDIRAVYQPGSGGINLKHLINCFLAICKD